MSLHTPLFKTDFPSKQWSSNETTGTKTKVEYFICLPYASGFEIKRIHTDA